MTDLHLHHDLYREASDRQDREAREWARSRSLQRGARSARSHRRDGGSSRRARLVAVLSSMVAVVMLAGVGALG